MVTVAALGFSGLADYTVRQGDTLSRIARRFGVSVAALAQANHLKNPDLIAAGERLKIPGGAAGGGFAYVVRSGDTLSGIAQRFGVSIASLAQANHLGSAGLLTRGQRITVPVARPRPAASRAQVQALLERAAIRYGWDPATVKALAMVESGWNNAVVSDSGAFGIMQVLPDTGRFVSRYVVKRPLDVRDPADNVEAGVAFLNHLYKLTGGDVRLTLGSYYQGYASVRQRGILAETDHYIDTILAVRRRY
ncbi:MAG: lytic transglycosylase domain-containing protein [Egibacteraceae bacterium]